jgi:hypothetical protein
MMINAPLDTPEHDLLSAMSALPESAETAVRYDERYARSMSLLGDRNIPRHFPLGRRQARERDTAAGEIDQTLAEFHDILVGVKPQFYGNDTNARWLRRLASHHLLQPLGVVHAKYSVLQSSLGNFATISTGNLVPANMTNLSLTLNSQPAAEFLKNAPVAENLSRTGYTEETIADGISLVLDYSNYGHPAQLPRINQLAESMIDPRCETASTGGELSNRKPVRIYFVSQYVPDGKLLKSLQRAQQEYGAKVDIPLQPRDDYRLCAVGSNALFAHFKHQIAGSDISTYHRPQSSHVKCLVVEYDDKTRSMLFGTDNFLTTMNKFVRNTELALYIDHAELGTQGYEIVGAVMSKLAGIKEIR